MLIRCYSKFDITETGTTGHFRVGKLPFTDKAGQEIVTESLWNRSRNQQRNLETIVQLLQLRSQISSPTSPQRRLGVWSFDFEVDSITVFSSENDALGLLKVDCEGVPMVTGLGEPKNIKNTINTLGKDPNLWFEIVEDK